MPGLMRAPAARELVLASASPTRARMLRDAGLVFRIAPADLDEAALRRQLRQRKATTAEAAVSLAQGKAEQVSRSVPEALVLGADQILEHEGAWLGKPETPEAVRHQLRTLSGSPHRLVSAVCMCVNGAVVWHAVDQAELTVRPLGERFLDRYIADAGNRLSGSVGGYRVEETGSQLFSRIEGDWFTILGLPLLPLLARLRACAVIEA